MIKAFIFDIDGTLVDTTQLHIDSWLKAFEESGVPMTAERIQTQLGRRATEIAKTLLPVDKVKDAEAIATEKKRIFREYYPGIKPFPMVKELFWVLHDRGVKLALATSTTRQDARFYVELLSSKDLIGALIAAEDIQRSKPDPEIFLKAAERLGVNPHESAVVGDSPHDIKAAVSAEMLAIGVLTGGFSAEQLLEAGADKIYDDIADLLHHIEKILR
ncbi:MAG: HAD family hydrolase [Candidatus Aquicultor sp.]